MPSSMARGSRWRRYLLLLALAGGLLLPGGCVQESGKQEMIEITLDRPEGNFFTLTTTESRATIAVTDHRGINGLNARLVEGAWPEEVVVQLRLQGLERLEIHYGNFTITTGRSSSNDSPDPPLMLSVIDEQGQVASASPSADIYYPDIQKTGDGFEITLPPHFHGEQYPSFSMQWIDFYRQ